MAAPFECFTGQIAAFHLEIFDKLNVPSSRFKIGFPCVHRHKFGLYLALC